MTIDTSQHPGGIKYIYIQQVRVTFLLHNDFATPTDFPARILRPTIPPRPRITSHTHRAVARPSSPHLHPRPVPGFAKKVSTHTPTHTFTHTYLSLRMTSEAFPTWHPPFSPASQLYGLGSCRGSPRSRIYLDFSAPKSICMNFNLVPLADGSLQVASLQVANISLSPLLAFRRRARDRPILCLLINPI